MSLLVLLAAIAVAAGCGPAEQPMSRAQARAVAREINLRPANLPTARHIPYTPPAAQRRALDATYRCVGVVPRSQALADLNSEQLVTPADTTLTSHVSVMRSTAVAARDIAALGSERARRCFAHPGPGETATLRVRALRPPVGVGPGVRVDSRERFRGHSFRLVTDQFAFQTGPAEVLVVVADVNRVPDAAFERSALTLLLHNARQALP